MSVCLRKLPKIRLSVVPSFAYIPPLRSGTAVPPLLSLPQSAAVRAGAHVNKRVLRSKNLQLYTQNLTAYIQLFYYIENIDFYQKRKDFLI